MTQISVYKFENLQAAFLLLFLLFVTGCNSQPSEIQPGLLMLSTKAANAGNQSPEQKTKTYPLGKGMLLIRVMKDTTTLASGLSHNHAIQAFGWSGTFSWNPENQACSVSIQIPVDSLKPDLPAARTFAGLEGELSDGTRQDIRKNMLSNSQLNSKNYPEISFTSNQGSLAGTTLTLEGKLTIRGVTKTVRVSVLDFKAGKTISGTGSFEIKATDFGFEPYSALFGQLKNKNTMTIMFQL